jgi:hypothetical protein
VTAFCRISNIYEILKRRYKDFPPDEIDPGILQLALRAEDRLLEFKALDKKVFAGKVISEV